MNWVALKMLTGDRSKYLGIIFGVTFAAMLIAWQASIFCGFMLRTTSQIRDIQDVSVWVMAPGVEYIDDARPMSDNDVLRVRGVEGVKTAVPFFKASGQARVLGPLEVIQPGQLRKGKFQSVILLGYDDDTRIGAPQEFTHGTSLKDLGPPDSVAIDETGYKFLWPNEPIRLPKFLELNDHRAVVRAVFKASQTFSSSPLLVTRYSQATTFAPSERRNLPFILVQHKDGYSPEQVAKNIQKATGLQAVTTEKFTDMSQWRYLRKTQSPQNLLITVLLGFVVGTAIAAQTFYLFTLENLKQFGALKAMGLSNRRIIGMILMQACLVSWIGYALGVGMATAYGVIVKTARPMMAYYMPWHVLVGTGVAVMLIAILASLISIRKVVVLEPAIVFRG
jgi:putative ABC transport system permease protein